VKGRHHSERESREVDGGFDEGGSGGGDEGAARELSRSKILFVVWEPPA